MPCNCGSAKRFTTIPATPVGGPAPAANQESQTVRTFPAPRKGTIPAIPANVPTQ